MWNLAWGRGLCPEIFDLFYAVRRDPFGCRTSRLEQAKYRDILSLIPPAQRALEVGCSEGVFTRMMAPRVGALTAVDCSPTALGRARHLLRGCDNVSLLQLDVARDAPEGSFDLVLVSEVLYYMGSNDQIRAVGRRLLDWLNPGGHLLLCHMRSQTDESEGFPVPRWAPAHVGAYTVHGLFDDFPELSRLKQLSHPLYQINLYQRQPAAAPSFAGDRG